LIIKGSFVNPYTHEEAISLIAKKAVDVKSLISHRVNMEELPGIMADYPKLNVLKAVVTY
jgi:L-iditol 2-dehydrogenase